MACCGVSERTTIKCIHSLHFEDSLSAAGGLQGASIQPRGVANWGERENVMLKEEKAFLVAMSIAIGTTASSVAIIGRYLPLAHGLLLGLAISLFYPVFIIAMVRFSMALKSWAYGEKSDDWVASGRETARAYLFILFPIVLPVLVIFYLSFGIVNRIFKYKTV